MGCFFLHGLLAYWFKDVEHDNRVNKKVCLFCAGCWLLVSRMLSTTTGVNKMVCFSSALVAGFLFQRC